MDDPLHSEGLRGYKQPLQKNFFFSFFFKYPIILNKFHKSLVPKENFVILTYNYLLFGYKSPLIKCSDFVINYTHFDHNGYVHSTDHL